MHGEQFLVRIYRSTINWIHYIPSVSRMNLGLRAHCPPFPSPPRGPNYALLGTIKSKFHKTSHHKHARILILKPRSGAEGHTVSTNRLQALTGCKQQPDASIDRLQHFKIIHTLYCVQCTVTSLLRALNLFRIWRPHITLLVNMAHCYCMG